MTVAENDRVSSQRYLADAAAGADAARDFVAILADAGPQITMVELRSLADSLEEPLSRARLVAARLANERLEDARLESQRALAASGFEAVVRQMEAVREAAGANDPRRTVDAADRLSAALEALRVEVGEPAVSASP